MKFAFLLSIFISVTIAIVSCEYDREEEEIAVESNPIDTTTTDTTTTTTTPPAVTYDNTVKAIMSANCASSGCHVAGGQSPDLSTYTKVNDQSARVKVRAVDLQTMPPGGGTMTAGDRDVLKNWIEDGAKEN